MVKSSRVLGHKMRRRIHHKLRQKLQELEGGACETTNVKSSGRYLDTKRSANKNSASFCMVLLAIGGPRPSREKKGSEGGKTALLKVQLFHLKRGTAALRVVTATRKHD